MSDKPNPHMDCVDRNWKSEAEIYMDALVKIKAIIDNVQTSSSVADYVALPENIDNVIIDAFKIARELWDGEE